MRYVLLFLLIMIFGTIKSQNLDCRNFKTGVFIDSSENVDFKTKITRTKDYQIEEYGELGITIKMKVVWLNNCSYKLEFIEGNEAWYEEFGEENDDDLIIKIIDIQDDYYIQETHFIENKIKPYQSKIKKVSDI